MKALQFGIASIVDSNTGHGLVHTGGRIDYGTAENDAHRIRSKTVTTLAQRIGKRVVAVLQTLRERRAQQRDIQQLARLNDHLLDDIGFSRGDISAAQSGQINLEQLAAGRRESQDSKRLQLRQVQTESQILVTDIAINEALYTRANCA
jgi:uncharacterized protein YjiS (DUF1127 family)